MDDPFPDSLPDFSSPRIYDPTLPSSMEEGDYNFYDVNEQFSSPPGMFEDDAMNDATFNSAPLKAPDQKVNTGTTASAPQWFNSPESSSGSDSSNQHKRASSTDSSAVGDVNMKNTSESHGMMIGTDSADDEKDNRFMESAFDFDSAASSPIPPVPESKAPIRISNGIRMPFRSGGPGIFAKPPVSTSNHSDMSTDARAPQKMIKNEHDKWQASPTQVLSPSDFVLNTNTSLPSWSQNDPSLQFDAPVIPPQSHFPLSTISVGSAFNPTTAPVPAASPPYPTQAPTLHVAPLPFKSRVETQSNVKLTIDPLPSHVTKLHLQPHTISKSKLMAKPQPDRSPDTYELLTTLVCTSAMQHRDKYERALARTAGTYQPSERQEGRRSSAGDANSTDDDENKPLNGGPVIICFGCIERERKRAARKKTKNQEEEELWLKDEAKRIVVFNTHEIKEWQTPSNSKTTEGNNRNMPAGIEERSFTSNAMQVDLPMRIACYCRHQEEKMGFRVIFTIRDHKNKFVAQTMSNSIIITDDHKTHPAPNVLQHPSMAYTDQPPLPPTNFHQPLPNTSGLNPFTRNAFSTTDLQGMQQQYTNGGFNNLQRPFAVPMPMETSQTTSATLTPRNLSRPASPSTQLSQQNKRRKASGSSRIRSDLMMTKMSTSSNTSPTPAFSNVPSTGLGMPGGQAAMPAFTPTYAPHGFPIAAGAPQFNTNPPTPSNTEGGFFSNMRNAPKSQSFDNLQHLQEALSAPTSIHNSRAPSPPTGTGLNEFIPVNPIPHSTGAPSNHAQLLSNSLQYINGHQNSKKSPVIHELTPTEGTKAGGYKVTCLGSGFSQGLEIMFGDALATTTTFWGDTTLVCLVPPALRAGIVNVTLKHPDGQHMPSPPNKSMYFKYVDDEQSELMRQMFAVLGGDPSMQGNVDPTDFTRYVLAYKSNLSSSPSHSSQMSGNYRQANTFGDTMVTEDLENTMLKCLEFLDLDDTPRKINLNFRGSNGQGMLHLCATLGFYRLTAGLLARGAHADLRDNNGMSPMHIAALHSNIRIIRKLRAVGGDPTLRSLNGFTPADMASIPEAQDASNALEHHSRSRSAIRTPMTDRSRTASVLSRESSVGEQAMISHRQVTAAEEMEPYRVHPMTPVQLRAMSRRSSFNSANVDDGAVGEDNISPSAPQYATQSALTAWRDQLSAQLQQVQQTVHRALPPLPNLPDYQGYPVVRRISSLVPQRNVQPSNGSPDTVSGGKETDSHWWDLLTGASSSPPAYEDIYPEKSRGEVSDKKGAVIQAAGDAFIDQKCETLFDQPGASASMQTVTIGKKSLTRQEQEQLRAAHAQKMKRLRSDRKLFFIWIPLLILVVVAMLRDRAPQLAYAARYTYSFVHDRFPRAVEEVQ